jgi:beta-glucosidase
MLSALVILAAAAYPWQDPSLSTSKRVDNLISLLTLEEKVSLLDASSPEIDRISLPGYRWGRECERGDASGKLGTAYPTGLALAASFDPALVKEIALQTAIEVRGNVNEDAAGGADFGASCFGPVSNLIRDSRWGRTAEMIGGEDPMLGRIMSRSFTEGFQTKYDNSSKYRMANTIAKHLNAYAGPEGHGFTFGPDAERFNFEAKMTEREWREFFLPPFFGAAEAGVTGFMCSYSSITLTDNLGMSHNTPACANAYLLTDIIRNEWNWTGYILSDAGAVAFVGSTSIAGNTWGSECPTCKFGHGYAKNASDAAVKAVAAGLDIELTCCGAPKVLPTLVNATRAGQMPGGEATIDQSLRRTLPIRFELGQLDPADYPPKKSNPYSKLGR